MDKNTVVFFMEKDMGVEGMLNEIKKRVDPSWSNSELSYILSEIALILLKSRDGAKVEALSDRSSPI